MRHLLLALVTLAPLAGMESSLRADGTMLVDGRPWFPFGYYHVSWVADRSDEPRVADLHAIADSGGNAMQPTLTSDQRLLDTLCDDAVARGVGLFAELYWAGRATEIPFLRRQQAIVAWNIGDDVNYPGNDPNITPAELRVRHQEVKALDPARATFAAGIVEGYDIAAYVGTVDIFGVESYPIGNYPEAEALAVHHGLCARAREVFAGSATSWILLPQTFAWEGQRYPTPVEVRNMIYAGLIEGARGMIGYTFYDTAGTTLPQQAPALWEELGRIAGEVRALEPVLIDGALSRPATGASAAKCGLWAAEGALHVVVINVSPSATATVAIELPAGSGSEAIPRFASRPSGLSVVAGRLVGTIAPRAVHAYRIDPPAAPASSFAWDVASAEVEEGGTVALTIVRSGDASAARSVAYATAPGSALAADVAPASGTVHFAAGESTRTVAITTLQDDAVEPRETFTVTLSAPSGGATLGAVATVGVAIVDDDGPAAGAGTPSTPTAGGARGCGLGSGFTCLGAGLALLIAKRPRRDV